MRTRDLCVAAMATALLAACSSGGSGASAGATVATTEDLARVLAESACQRRDDCCAPAGRGFDVAACAAGERDRIMADLTGATTPGVERTLDAAAAQRCMDLLSGPSPGCRADAPVDLELPEECLRVLDGPLAPGDTCVDDTDCRGFSSNSARCLEHACVTLQEVGETCSDDRQCRGGDVAATDCLASGGDGFCDAPIERPTSACAYGNDSVEGTCVTTKRGVAGDPCFRMCRKNGRTEFCSDVAHDQSGSELAVCYANDGLQCSPDGVCAPLVPLGGACRGYESAIACEAGSFCHAGTCVALGGEGASCVLGRGSCAAGLSCNGSSCVPLLPDGASCDSAAQCGEDSFCLPGGTCQPMQGAGGPCETDAQCAGTLCDRAAGRCVAPEELACAVGAS